MSWSYDPSAAPREEPIRAVPDDRSEQVAAARAAQAASAHGWATREVPRMGVGGVIAVGIAALIVLGLIASALGYGPSEAQQRCLERVRDQVWLITGDLPNDREIFEAGHCEDL